MSIGADETVVALYDYTAKEPEELSIRKNEQLVLIEAKFAWWKVRNGGGKFGLVPSNYLRRDKGKGESLVNRIANKLPGGRRGKVSNATGGVASAGGVGAGAGKLQLNSAAAPAPIPSPPSQLNEEYVSIFNYEAEKGDELSLSKGMRVLVLRMEEDGWWYGRDADRSESRPGYFPSNYVAKNSQNAAPPNNSAPKVQANGNCLMTVRCLYPFVTENPEELGFEQDEILHIVEEPLDDPEWWQARNSDGQVGLVPKNYVEIVPDSQPSPNPSADVSTTAPRKDVIAPSTVNDSSDSSNAIEDKEWFFGRLKRSEAESLLSDRAKNGEFLVRNSETSAGEYSISMKMPGRIRHFKVTVMSDRLFGIGQKRFESIDDLLEHYKRSPIFTSQEQGKFYLTNPLPR